MTGLEMTEIYEIMPQLSQKLTLIRRVMDEMFLFYEKHFGIATMRFSLSSNCRNIGGKIDGWDIPFSINGIFISVSI